MYPKQFCAVFTESLLAQTLKRIKELDSFPLIVAHQDTKALVEKQRAAAEVEGENIFEPIAKNTASAMALATHQILKQATDPEDTVVAFFPADHRVGDESVLLEAVKKAAAATSDYDLLLIGIKAHTPRTGYGYIEVGAELRDQWSPRNRTVLTRVESFIEKPDQATAKDLVEKQNYLWNSGIFVSRLSVLVRHMELWNAEAWRQIRNWQGDARELAAIYANLSAISFDHAVTEKLAHGSSKNTTAHTDRIGCVAADMNWSDVGSWDEVADTIQKSDAHSRSAATVVEDHAARNFVYASHKKLVTLLDVNDLIVVDTPDAQLITRRGSSEKVKNLVERLKMDGLKEIDQHNYEERPWGSFMVLLDASFCKVKQIQVKPFARLSYQSHEHRQEHWIMVSGRAEVTIDDELQHLSGGQSCLIPLKAKHRIFNPGPEPLVFIEVQTGTYFGEDDIKRYQDDYQRL